MVPGVRARFTPGACTRSSPSFGWATGWARPRWRTCSFSKTSLTFRIGPEGTPARLRRSIHVALGWVDQDLLQLGVQGAPVARAVGQSAEARVVGEGLDAQGAAEPAEHRLPRGRDVDVAVLGLEDPGGDARGMIVPGLGRDLAADEPARGLEVEHRHHGLEQGGVHPLAAPAALALEQRQENALREVEPRRQVGDGDADPHGALAGQTGHGHQPTHALGDLVVAGAVAVGPVLAEAGDRGVDQPRIHGAEALVVDAEPVLHVGAEVLHQHVGARRQALEDLAPARGLEVEGHRALVAVQILEVEAVARRVAVDVGARLDLDDAGSHVGELPDAGRSRARAGEIDDGVGGERQCVHGGLDDTPSLPMSQSGTIAAGPPRPRVLFSPRGSARIPRGPGPARPPWFRRP